MRAMLCCRIVLLARAHRAQPTAQGGSAVGWFSAIQMIFPPSPPFKGCWPNVEIGCSRRHFFRSHVEPGTNSTCPAFFSRECTDTGSTYPERFVELGGVDVLGWTAHASWPTRAAVHAGKVLEGVAAEEHYWVLWPPCRWSKNETRGWWPGGGGKMVCRKDTQLMRENVSETDVASACVRCCVS